MTALPVLLLLAGADPFGPAVAHELTYAGRISPVAVAAPDAPEKGFSAIWLVSREAPSESLFVVAETTAALPWPLRFGFCPAEGGDAGPRLGYRFDGKDHVVELPGASLKHADPLATGGEVVDGPFKFTAAGERTIEGRDCRLVEVSTNFGRESTIAFEKSTGLVVRYEREVVLGRGDRFRLTLELTEVDPLDAVSAAERRSIAEQLRLLANSADRGDGDSAADLTAEARAAVTPVAARLAETAAGTPYGDLAAAVRRDLDDQSLRADGVDGLAKRIVGSPAPLPELRDLDGRPIAPDSLKGKVVVLHFWEYDNESLAAPYGQVGYLDFIHRKRGKLGVSVVGVAVNSDFADEEKRGPAARSAKNLAGFMNLGYPIATDDGGLLRTFGDPRSVDATLPLWVVIGPDGIVRAYKPGLYDLEANEGLKELDATVVDLVKERRTESP